MNLQFGRGAHVCHLFDDQHQAKAVTLEFFKEGLQRGELCAMVTLQPDDWYLELQAYGIDVASERLRGSLVVIPAAEWRHPGEFNSIVMARAAWNMIGGALANHWGFRLVVDMAWTLEPLLPDDQLCHWEATGSVLLEDTEVRAICQYDLGRHSPASVHAALRTHSTVLLDGHRIENPFYEARTILDNEPLLNGSEADAGKIQDMLNELRKLS